MKKEFTILSPELGGHSLKKMTVPHYWCGGAEGAECDWHEPLNWYNRRVPGWFDHAIIPGCLDYNHYFPEIHHFMNDIVQLTVEPGGRLLIGRQGRLSVDGMYKKGLGIINEGEIIIFGELSVHRTKRANIQNKGLISNNGSLAMDKNENNGIIMGREGRFENFGELLFI